jgi:hypothetical protein
VARHSEQSLLRSPFVLERYTVNGICLKVKIFLHALPNAKSLSAYNLLIKQRLGTNFSVNKPNSLRVHQ